MTMEILPCLWTSLDRMEIDDLKKRVERLVGIVMAAGDPERVMGGSNCRIRNAQGTIVLSPIGEGLSMNHAGSADMGSFKLIMPMPVGGDIRVAKVHRLGRNDLIRLLHIWLGYLDSAVQTESGKMKSPGADRLATCISSVLKTSNPDVPNHAAIQVVTDPPYVMEGDERSRQKAPGIFVGNKPCFAKEVERRILELHPAANIDRTMGSRQFTLSSVEAIDMTTVETSIPEMLRTMGSLNLRDMRKPVLKAGLGLK